MKIDESAVKEALARVEDPEVKKSLAELRILKGVTVRRDSVVVELELTSPACPFREQIEASVRAAVQSVPGVAQVEVLLSSQVAMRPLGPGGRLANVRNIIAVAAGKGGVGKSTTAVNLALALKATGARVGVLDADVFGPSMPTMLGPPEVPSATLGEHRIEPAVHYGMPLMSIGFFVERGGAVIWRGPIVHRLLQQFLDDVSWGELDYLVLDLPPGTSDVQLSLSQLIPITGAVMVTTPQEIAVIDVLKAVAMWRKVEVPILGIVENMSHYTCPACGHVDAIFSEGGGRRIAEDEKIEFLGAVPMGAAVRHGGDHGTPVVLSAPDSEPAQAFRAIARRVACKLSASKLTGPRRARGLVAIS